MLVGLAFGSEWVYRNFLRPIDPLQPEVLALAKHFNQSGLRVRPYAVHHGYPHSEMVAAAAFEIIGYPLPIAIDLCPDEAAAKDMLSVDEVSPNLMHPMRNGRLVMNLPMWGDDTDKMAAKVEEIFSSFHH